MQFEHVDLFPTHVCHLVRSSGGLVCGRQEQWIFTECTAIKSVADAEPVIIIRGFPCNDATLSAGTITAAAAPSPVGEASKD